MRIALKLLTSSIVLLSAAVWLGGAIRTCGEQQRGGRAALTRRDKVRD
jgi:hypothetical protein